MSNRTEDRENPPQHQKKKFTGRQLLENMSRFAEDFGADLDPSDSYISTPEADLGIGPVKYQVKFKPIGYIQTAKLDLLNRLIKLEKSNGDMLIKLDAVSLALVLGKETRFKRLLPLLRTAIRIENQEYVEDCIRSKDLAANSLTSQTQKRVTHYQLAASSHSVSMPPFAWRLITYFDKRKRLANGHEVAVIADALRGWYQKKYRRRHPPFHLNFLHLRYLRRSPYIPLGRILLMLV